MGSPISPVIANLYMELFEQHALSTFPGLKPRLWLRYVDDTFVILNADQQDSFFNFINSLDTNIKFTQENPKDNTLSFLDTAIHRHLDGTLITKVYRKPINTDHYLRFESNHPLIHKLGVIRTLDYRAETVSSSLEDTEAEKSHIREALRACGYPKWSFHKATKSPDNTVAAPRRCNNWVTIPYFEGGLRQNKEHFPSLWRVNSLQACQHPKRKACEHKGQNPQGKDV